MAATAFRIESFRADGNNVTIRWKKWKSEFINFLEANDLNGDAVTNKRKLAIFLLVYGDDLKRPFGYTSDESPTIKEVFAKFDEHFAETSNEIFASYQFQNVSLQQHEGETFDEFYKKVQEAAVDCNFEGSSSRNIRDKLIIGITNNALRERFLREKTIDEKAVVEQCRISEKSHIQSVCMATSSMNIKDESQINVLRTTKFGAKPREFLCNNCGKTHAAKKCPAFGHKCHTCGKPNHWKKQCRSNRQRTVNELTDTDENLSEHLFISELVIDSIGASGSDWFPNALFNKTYIVNCKLDTGAQANVISQQRLDQMKELKSTIVPTNKILRGFGGSQIDVSGLCYIDVKLNGQTHNLSFLISKVDTKTIIGFSACKSFDLIKDIAEISTRSPEALLQKYNDVFEGKGRLKTITITLADNAEPYVAFPRKIPLALYKPVQMELERMCKENIITKVSEPTDWVSNMHVISKDNNIRIVLDPRPLNKFIKRPHFYIPTNDELLSMLSGWKWNFHRFGRSDCFLAATIRRKKLISDNIHNTFWEISFLKNALWTC